MCFWYFQQVKAEDEDEDSKDEDGGKEDNVEIPADAKKPDPVEAKEDAVEGEKEAPAEGKDEL